MEKGTAVEKPKERVTRKFYNVTMKDGKYIAVEVPEKAYAPIVMIHGNPRTTERICRINSSNNHNELSKGVLYNLIRISLHKIRKIIRILDSQEEVR